MAQRYGVCPAELVDPRREMTAYEWYCFNEGVYYRGVLEEIKRHEEQEQHRDDPPRKDKQQGDAGVLDIAGKGKFSGVISGVIGEISPEMKKRYIKAGGKWREE